MSLSFESDDMLMNRILYLVLFVSTLANAQSFQLSDKAKISVITCGPFQGELYSAFGHSAFRVYDATQQIDEVYNYGMFDFSQSNFYLNFAKGIPYYKLGVYEYPRFRDTYIYYNRFLHEQVLNLTPAQTQKLFDFLQWNALPENANYRYDYFYDNCATKIRDVVATVFGDTVRFDDSYISSTNSIRDLTDLYLKQQPWGDLGIDVCLGLPMDKKASPREHMFLPDYIEAGFDHATIKQGEIFLPIVEEKIIVYASRDEDPIDGPPHPLYIFTVLALLAIGLSIYNIKRKKLSNWFDIFLFGLTGLIGLLLVILWFATNHKAAANNFNILWALPTHLIAVIAFIRNPKWLSKYFMGVSILCVTLLVLWTVLPQQLNYSLIPVVVALGVRAYTQFHIRKRALLL